MSRSSGDRTKKNKVNDYVPLPNSFDSDGSSSKSDNNDPTGGGDKFISLKEVNVPPQFAVSSTSEKPDKNMPFGAVILPFVGTFVYFTTMLPVPIAIAAVVGLAAAIVNAILLMQQLMKGSPLGELILLFFAAFGPMVLFGTLAFSPSQLTRLDRFGMSGLASRWVGSVGFALSAAMLLFSAYCSFRKLEIQTQSKYPKTKILLMFLLASLATLPLWVLGLDQYTNLGVGAKYGISTGGSILIGIGIALLVYCRGETLQKNNKERFMRAKHLFIVLLAGFGTLPFWSNIVLADPHLFGLHGAKALAMRYLLASIIAVFTGITTAVLINKKNDFEQPVAQDDRVGLGLDEEKKGRVVEKKPNWKITMDFLCTSLMSVAIVYFNILTMKNPRNMDDILHTFLKLFGLSEFSTITMTCVAAVSLYLCVMAIFSAFTDYLNKLSIKEKNIQNIRKKITDDTFFIVIGLGISVALAGAMYNMNRFGTNNTFPLIITFLLMAGLSFAIKPFVKRMKSKTQPINEGGIFTFMCVSAIFIAAGQGMGAQNWMQSVNFPGGQLTMPDMLTMVGVLLLLLPLYRGANKILGKFDTQNRGIQANLGDRSSPDVVKGSPESHFHTPMVSQSTSQESNVVL
jgi:hypothetical protein